MKNLIIKNGLYASLVLVGIHLVVWVISDGEPNYETGEIIGYASMIVCMVFVFLGIREYRNVELNGNMTFSQALGMGVLVALVPALAFGAYDLLYILYLNPDFNETYFAHYLDEMKASMSLADFEIAKKDLEAQKEFWDNSFLQFTVMFLTVFVIGFIAALISSSILRTKTA